MGPMASSLFLPPPPLQWYAYSDPGMEEALYEIPLLRRFVGVDLGRDFVPDETTILKFRRLLERHDLARAIFDEVRSFCGRKACCCRKAGWWTPP